MIDILKNGVTVEDIARAWASIDGKRDEFDRGKVDKEYDDEAGYYDGYVIEAEDSLRKFCWLAAKGNPSVLLLLWLPEFLVKTEIGAAAAFDEE